MFALMAMVGVVAAFACAAPASAASGDNTGTDFWVGYMTNFTGGAEKTMFITGGTATTGNVSVPGLGFSQDYNVTPGTVTSVPLPAGAEMPQGEGKANVAVHVTSADPVTVYGLNRIQFTTDAYLGLPVTGLANTYTVMTWKFGCCGSSEFGIVASQNGTSVTITPKVATSGGHAAGTPYQVDLNQGEMYQANAATQNEDLSGTKVESSAPVAVFGGHQCADIPDNGFSACDHVEEQLMPDQSWGTSFLTVPLKTRQGGDTFNILASQDGTAVKINGTDVATLNAGEVTTQNIQGNSTITADKPVEVAQFSNGSTFDGVTSDPFMMLVPPFEQFQSGYTITTPATGFPNNFVNLVVPNTAVDSIRLDGQPLPAGTFSPIGSTEFSGAQVDLTVGSHTLTGNGQPFGAFVYGYASFDSYGYPGGLSLAPVALVNAISVSPPSEDVLVNTEHCVSATVTDSNGGRVPNVRVDFSVTGANPTTSSANAGPNGEPATFCYTGTNVGVDTITATVGSTSGTATKNWVTTLPSPAAPLAGAAAAPTVTPTTPPCEDTRRFTFRLHHAKGQRIVKVEVLQNGKRIKARTGRDVKSITINTLPQGTFTIRIVSTQSSGSKLISTRRYNGCEKGKPKTRAVHHKRKKKSKR